MKRILALETPNKINETIQLKGWIHSIRDMGKIAFVDFRDVSGIVQLVFTDDNFKLIKQLKPEYVVMIEGKVIERSEKYQNPKIPTGKVEISVEKLEIINQSETPPFEIDKDLVSDEETRLKYRYLDLRHEKMKNNLILRHNVTTYIRDFLNKKGFLEIETPILTTATPEGARDFLVLSRRYPGSFYALPQSPQQYKQLLMVAGLDKYYQIARCMRDEDSRGDRQPEFTQLDIEMSFVKQEDILNLTEELFTTMVNKLFPNKKMTKTPWPRLTHKETITKYKSDKPDLRKDKKDTDELAFAWIVDFPLFEKNKKTGKIESSHHPFTAPREEDIDKLDKDPLSVISTSYDVVLNGFELGSGSIRIHDPKLLIKMFSILGLKEAEIKSKFGHMIEAFKYGVPPHGGIAPGLDRLIMLLANEPNIREVIAFPKTDMGRDPMMGAPTIASKEQLKDLGISIKK